MKVDDEEVVASATTSPGDNELDHSGHGEEDTMRESDSFGNNNGSEAINDNIIQGSLHAPPGAYRVDGPGATTNNANATAATAGVVMMGKTVMVMIMQIVPEIMIIF